MPLIPSEVFQARLGTSARVQIAGVVLPGTLLLLEIWLIAHGRHDLLGSASRATAGVGAWVLTVAALATALVAVMVGFVNRGVAWRLYGPGSSRIDKRMGGSAVARALEKIEDGFGPQAVEVALLSIPHVAEMFRHGDVATVRSFCKGWLRTREPLLTIDLYQVEISFIVALTGPLAVSPFVALRFLAWPWPGRSAWNACGALLAVAVAVALLAVAWRRATNRRVEELQDGVRNYFLAHLYCEDPRGGSGAPA